MKHAVNSLFLLALAAPLVAGAQTPPVNAGGSPPQPQQQPMAGGYSPIPVSDPVILAAANMAVEGETYYLKNQPGGETTQLTLVSITNAEQQVVAGMNYRLQLKVKHNGRERDAEAVLYKPLSGNPMTMSSWSWK